MRSIAKRFNRISLREWCVTNRRGRVYTSLYTRRARIWRGGNFCLEGRSGGRKWNSEEFALIIMRTMGIYIYSYAFEDLTMRDFAMWINERQAIPCLLLESWLFGNEDWTWRKHICIHVYGNGIMDEAARILLPSTEIPCFVIFRSSFFRRACMNISLKFFFSIENINYTYIYMFVFDQKYLRKEKSLSLKLFSNLF